MATEKLPYDAKHVVHRDGGAMAGACQYPTKFDKYGLPAATCGAPAVEYRPDRLFVRYVCCDHR